VVWSVGVCAAKRVFENSPLAGENRDEEDGDEAVRSLREAGGEVGVEIVAHHGACQVLPPRTSAVKANFLTPPDNVPTLVAMIAVAGTSIRVLLFAAIKPAR
jgi:hypothetical protein